MWWWGDGGEGGPGQQSAPSAALRPQVKSIQSAPCWADCDSKNVKSCVLGWPEFIQVFHSILWVLENRKWTFWPTRYFFQCGLDVSQSLSQRSTKETWIHTHIGGKTVLCWVRDNLSSRSQTPFYAWLSAHTLASKPKDTTALNLAGPSSFPLPSTTCVLTLLHPFSPISFITF